MNPEALSTKRTQLDAAGRALRARPVGETLDALCRALDAWSDPESNWRKRLAEELPPVTGFSPETVQEGVRIGLAHWDGAALRKLVERERCTEATGFETTALFLAGSIPMPSLVQMLAPLVLGSPVLAKSAARDPVTPSLFAASIAEADALLGECVAAVQFSGEDAACVAELLDCTCIVATGSDETVAAVRARVPDGARLVEHGHRLSLAALGPDAGRRDALDGVASRLAVDIALWDQLGCLSPIAVYVVGERAASDVAEALAEKLAGLEGRMPRGTIEPAGATAFAQERAEAEMRAASGKVQLYAGDADAWAVVLEPTAGLRPAPLHRFVRVLPVVDAAGVTRAAAPYAPHLAGVAMEGFGTESEAVSSAFRALGASRICRPGALQAPPLGWNRGGHGVLRSLARTPVETDAV